MSIMDFDPEYETRAKRNKDVVRGIAIFLTLLAIAWLPFQILGTKAIGSIGVIPIKPIAIGFGIIVLLLVLWRIGRNKTWQGYAASAGTTVLGSGKFWRGAIYVLATLILLIYVTNQGMTRWAEWQEKVARYRAFGAATSQLVSASIVPADVALPIIAQCESGGRQFEADGTTPLKNKKGSSAIGKYQILASEHEAKAKALGWDIRTLEGNEGYARYLYAESGTKHWEADPNSRACWEPKLVALGYKPSPLPYLARVSPAANVSMVLTTNQPSRTIEVPPMWRWDMVGQLPDNWKYSHRKDARGMLLVTFDIVPPAEQVELEVAVTRCATVADCRR